MNSSDDEGDPQNEGPPNEAGLVAVQVMHIPGGCTSLCQPVDSGVNTPFKNRLCSEWQTWMINEGLQHGTTSAPTRANIID
jgi:DDE superfamily endonuclease